MSNSNGNRVKGRKMTTNEPIDDTNLDDSLRHGKVFRERLAVYGRRVADRAESGDDELYDLVDWAEHEYYQIVEDMLDLAREEPGFDECMQVTIREINDCKDQAEHKPFSCLGRSQTGPLTSPPERPLSQSTLCS
jgi:hypothetical protein